MIPAAERCDLRQAALAVALGAAALDVFFLLALALGVLPIAGLREREIPLSLTAVTEGTSPVRFGPREVIVNVGPTGDIRAGGSSMDATRLAATLSRLAADCPDASVTVRADARAPYGTVARVLAAARRAGIRDASLLTVEPPPGR